MTKTSPQTPLKERYHMDVRSNVLCYLAEKYLLQSQTSLQFDNP
jgi:hypothetical protein